MLINESELRAHWHQAKTDVITIPRGSVLTPSARDFLRGNGIRVKMEGEGLLDIDQQPLCTAKSCSPAPPASAPGRHR